MGSTLYDMHIHTKYSCDSTAELEAYCAEAIKKGVSAICFTDHVDYNVKDCGYGYYNAKEFLREFSHVKEKYRGSLTLLCGVEFAEPHLYQDKLAELSALPYDYILGTLHFWYKDMFPSSMIEAGIPAETCYKHYWDEVLAAVKAGGFDALGHMDFPKRYYNSLIFDHDKINEISTEMARKNICLEINTSSLGKNIAETMPDKEILSIYKSCGGKYVTIGSDAHTADQLAAGYTYAKKLIDYFAFEEVIFAQRKMHNI